MAKQVTFPDPVLADNQKTVELLIKSADGDMARISEINEWGVARQNRIDMLCRFAGLLEKHGIIGGDGKMSKIMTDFVTTQCFAIATRHGLDGMEYEFNDSESGPLSSDLNIDLQAVEPTPVVSPTGLFDAPENELRFLDAVRGKNVHELGGMARLCVIDERYRIYA